MIDKSSRDELRVRVDEARRAQLAGRRVKLGLAAKATGGRQKRGRRRLDPSGRLTPRQCDVVRLIAAGAENAEIAEVLHVAAETVKSHVRDVLFNLRARTRAEAVAIALRRGLIE